MSHLGALAAGQELFGAFTPMSTFGILFFTCILAGILFSFRHVHGEHVRNGVFEAGDERNFMPSSGAMILPLSPRSEPAGDPPPPEPPHRARFRPQTPFKFDYVAPLAANDRGETGTVEVATAGHGATSFAALAEACARAVRWAESTAHKAPESAGSTVAASEIKAA
jgi:hypothetical protein